MGATNGAVTEPVEDFQTVLHLGPQAEIHEEQAEVAQETPSNGNNGNVRTVLIVAGFVLTIIVTILSNFLPIAFKWGAETQRVETLENDLKEEQGKRGILEERLNDLRLKQAQIQGTQDAQRKGR